MNIKSSKLLAVILILVVSALALTGCGKSGNRFDNKLPEIKITSYEGWSDDFLPSNVDPDSVQYVFQQRIYWHATDTDGVIAGYAFRILDENREPIAVPGYEYISDGEDGLIPDDMLSEYGKGWVIHYLPGADQSVPLDSLDARRSIWTSQKYAVINFPAANELGEPMPTISYFEVVAIDNRGGITPEVAWRKFRATSEVPTCTVSTTKGNPDGKEVGSGLNLLFNMHDTDPFISPLPFKYEFKMVKVDNQGAIIQGSETEWFDTSGQDYINEYRLTRYTNPPLTYDFDENGVSNTSTKIIARATDMAGVVSDVETSLPLTFKVKPGFRPHTQMYSTKTLALGDYHYEDWGDDTTEETLPFTIINGTQRFATCFFQDMNRRNTVVFSDNLKSYMRWGWVGEYGIVSPEGETYNEDDPYGKKVDVVLDRASKKNYFSEITHFDIRFDGDPYNYPPFSHSIKTDDDGTRWLRLPVNTPLIMQSIVLTGAQMEVGPHTFEVRCVDLQDEVDPEPAVFAFDVLPYVEPANRSGVLVIDDDNDNTNYSPESIVNDKYANMLSDVSNVVTLKRSVAPAVYDSLDDTRNRILAFSDMMQYKAVLYHSDNPQDNGTIDVEYDGLNLYLMYGGNLIISHTQALASKLDDIRHSGLRRTLIRQMGFQETPGAKFLGASLTQNPFFQGASGLEGFPDVNLNYTDSFNPIINGRHGLAAITYFPILGTGFPIYTMNCKPVDYPTFPPNQTQYDRYNGQTVGVKHVTNSGGKVYTFGFPFSYMQDADAKALINKVMSEL
ncbi:MAG: hypothetical protein PHY21_00295 [Candidatus Cloacimonetes bacterium]|nr:hypothetical protein [Candidatus Cloacimonadota bacterium]